MRKIILLCAAGMSTSLLVNKMREYADARGYEYEISAEPIAEAATVAVDADIIMLGPQVRFQAAAVKRACPNKPVVEIDMRAYGTINGEAVVEAARAVMEQ